MKGVKTSNEKVAASGKWLGTKWTKSDSKAIKLWVIKFSLERSQKWNKQIYDAVLQSDLCGTTLN